MDESAESITEEREVGAVPVAQSGEMGKCWPRRATTQATAKLMQRPMLPASIMALFSN